MDSGERGPPVGEILERLVPGGYEMVIDGAGAICQHGVA
jgi:hypothetical protein